MAIDHARLGQWIRELVRHPQSAQQVQDRVCRGLSEALSGLPVWVELVPWPPSGFPTPPDCAFKNGQNGELSWVPRRIQQEGRTLLWLPLGVGWIAFVPDAEQLKRLGSQRLEAILVAVALHLWHLGTIENRERFMAIASHELKTPLTAIYGMVQLQERMLRTRVLGQGSLEDWRQEQERHLSFSRIVLRQLERLTALIDGLMDLARIRAGRFTVEPIPIDAARAVREIDEGRLQLLAHEAGVELMIEIPERLATRLDPLRFDEVVTNLVMSSIRRSPEGGQVRLRLSAQDGEVQLEVIDQGSPIAASDREQIFEPFSAPEQGSGLGLGLYIARQIARLHQGEVKFVSGPDGPGVQGNTVRATFWATALQSAQRLSLGGSGPPLGS